MREEGHGHGSASGRFDGERGGRKTKREQTLYGGGPLKEWRSVNVISMWKVAPP